MSAALRMAWPARPALPPADSGRMRATLTWPVPIVAPGAGSGAPAAAVCGALENRLGLLEKTLELLEHPATKTAVVASKPASERRRDSIARTCNSADMTAPLTLF